MSTSRSQILQALLTLRGHRSTDHIASWECSENTRNLLEEVAFMWTLCIFDTCHTNLRTTKGVYTLMCKGPLDVVISDCKKLDIELLHAIGEDKSPAFECAVRDLCPVSRQLYELLRYEIGLVARDGDIGATRQMHQVLNFASRITIKDHPKAEENAFAKYIDAMKRIQAHDDVLATERMECWIENLFKGYEDPLKGFSPHHSSGAVAEKARRKNGSFRPLFPEERWALTHGPITHYLLSQAGIQSYPAPYREATNRVTHLIWVPKGVDTRRGIEPEPAELMFCQHGLAESLNSVLRQKLRTHYNQHDSSQNTRAAHDASISRLYDTLDLSSASDSVRWTLVKSLFARLPKWQRLLSLVRSKTSVWPDGSQNPKVAYGSMGNPLTFPLEVLTFSCFIEEAGARLDVTNFRYWVYGDDLIVPHYLTDTLVELLEEYGFQVNLDKSFVGLCPFRESCGGDFIDGVDVTPVRISRTWTGSFAGKSRKLKPKQIVSLVDLANRCSTRLPSVRWYCIDTLKKYKVDCAFSSDRTGACVMWARKPQNLHLRSKELGGDLQYRKVKCARPILKLRQLPTKKNSWIEDCLYWHWLESHQTDSTVRVSTILETLQRAGTPVPVPHMLSELNENGRHEFEAKELLPKLADKGELEIRHTWCDDIFT